MSYQVLARKWRPGNFAQVAGQAHVLKTLINALDNDRLHHAYLFTGTRGVGKTTLARILAKCLNCDTGISSTPCGECGSCKEIAEGRFIDLIEVDAASRTKVEDTRELLENVQYTPAIGRFKVYLIDEVHMLSNHSFNALLKTLEEPPPHVKFLFATTDPHKLPVTILSRCLQLNLKNLNPKLITEYLSSVLDKEQIAYEQDALWQIAAAAEGSMRDALTLVDQAISYCQGTIKADGVIEMLGIPQQQQVYALLAAMQSGDVQRVINLIFDMSEQTPDYGKLLNGLLSILHRIAIAQVLPVAVDNSFGDRQQIQDLAGKFTAEDIQLYYQLGLKGREDLNLAAEARNAFEMLIIRMMVFSPEFSPGTALKNQPVAVTTDEDLPVTDGDSADSDEELPVTEEGLPDSDGDLPVTEEGLPDSDEELPVTEEGLPGADGDSPGIDEGLINTEVDTAGAAVSASEKKKQSVADELSSVIPEWDTADRIGVDCAATKDEKSDNSAATEPPSRIEQLTHASWLNVYSALKINGIASNILANTEFDRATPNALFLTLDQSQSAVYSDDLLPKMSQAISDFYGTEVQLHINIGETNRETPALLSQRLKHERHLELINEFEQDENVQELLKRFSGTLAVDSIAPLKD